MEWASGVQNRQSGIAGSGMGWTEWNGMDGVEWDGRMEWDGWSPEWKWEGGKMSEMSEMDFVEIWYMTVSPP